MCRPLTAPQALGTPSDANWPGCRDLPNFLNFEAREPKPLRQHFPRGSEDALDLLKALLQLDPSKRPTGGGLAGCLVLLRMLRLLCGACVVVVLLAACCGWTQQGGHWLLALAAGLAAQCT
jgi:hypothetical protein